MKRLPIGRMRASSGSATIVAVAVALLVPFFTSGGAFQLQQYEYLIVLVVLCVSVSVITGFAGQLSLSSSAVFMVAGYVVCILINDHPRSVGLWLGCLVGTAVGVALGAVLALPALRVGGFYLAMITLFVALLVPTVVGSLTITGGQSGISLISNPGFNQSYAGTGLYEIFVGLALVSVVVSAAVLHSRLGRRFVLLRTSEELAASIGVASHWTKIVAFMIGSGVAGLAGAMYVYSQQLMNPQSITATTAFYLVAACVIGGLGRVVGPVIGGLLVFGVEVLLTSLDAYQGLIFGAALGLFVIAAPDGIVGLGATALNRIRTAMGTAREPVRPAPADGTPGDGTPGDGRPGEGTPGEGTPVAAAGTDDGALQAAGHGTANADSAEEKATPGAPMELRGVGRRFGGVSAVEDVDLTITPGTVHGLVGSNGSGKTTLLNLICGYYSVHAGEIRIGAHSLGDWAPHRVARHAVARTFQTPKLVPGQSVIANVLPAAEVAARSSNRASVLRLPAARRARRRAQAEVMTILRELDLTRWKDVPAENLPHGTQRLTEIARALAMQPRFLLLDEPAAGLSPGEVATLGAVVRRAADNGIGVLLIEHNIPFVLEIADELTVMDRGRRLASGPPSILQNRSISSVFLGSGADGIASEAST
jgi:ABC-type branched-subunit amino acid transport system ATPase component/ABC-type branched-subunit amino acid transport system permease subunit